MTKVNEDVAIQFIKGEPEKIDVSISGNNIMEVKSTYNWSSEKEFERFMRFAERYSKSFKNL